MATSDKPAAKSAAKPQVVAEKGASEVKAPGSSGQATAPSPERVKAEIPGTKDVHSGTSAGEQIAGTPAKGVEVPDSDGGTVPEAAPNDLPEVQSTGEGVEEVKDGATNQPAPGSAPSLQQPMADTTADGGGTQGGGHTALPAQFVGRKGDTLADSAEGAKGAPTAEQAKQHEGSLPLYASGQEANVDNESPGRAIRENTPAVPENTKVADGLAEALSTTDARTTRFATQSRQAPHLAK